MEYYNIIIFVLIFISLLTCFYLIINNFGVNNKINNFPSEFNIDFIEKKISSIKSELYSIKNEINTKNSVPLVNLAAETYYNTISKSQSNNNIQNSVPLINLATETYNTVSNLQSNNNIRNLVPLVNLATETYNTVSNLQSTNTVSNLQPNINNIVPLSNLSGETHNNSMSNTQIIIGTEPIVNYPNQNQSCSTNGTCSKPPPIIYDPIANYDIAKLTDPLVDPRGRTSADQIPTPQVAAQFNFPTQGVLDRYHRVGLLIAIEKSKIEMPYSETNSEFNWSGLSNTNKNKKKKRYISTENDSSSNKVYRGVQIKEGFDSDYDSDDDSYDDSSDDSIEEFISTKPTKNIYNIYNNSNDNDNNILELIGKKVTDNWYKYFTSISIGNKIIKVTIHNKNRKELYSGDIIYIPELKKEYKVKMDPMDMIEYNPYMF